MAVNDLTPRLRTRLTRAEKTIGILIALAILVFVAAFAYYVYRTAERKGWFIRHATYFVYLKTAQGLAIGDPVTLRGFQCGEITRINTTPAADYWHLVNQHYVYVQFRIRDPYFGYIWSDSQVRVSGDFLGARAMEVTSGRAGKPTVFEQPEGLQMREWLFDTNGVAVSYVVKPEIGLPADETPALSDAVSDVVGQVQDALPGVLSLTNDIRAALVHSTVLLGRLDEVAQTTRPVMTNLAAITANLTNANGSLGEWLIPPQLNGQMGGMLSEASNSVRTLTAELRPAAANLRRQLEQNKELLKEISDIVVHTDGLVEGLKRHWFLRGAFEKEAENEGVTEGKRGRGP